MRKVCVLGYGVAAYLAFLAVVLYAIGFVEDLWVPRSLDSPATTAPLRAIATDTLLLGLFAAQHSVMARAGFKRWWARLVPQAVERSTYVLVASLALGLVFWQWRPVSPALWQVDSPAGAALLRAASFLGWGIALLSSFMVSHFDMLGLRQAWLRARGLPYRPTRFTTSALYRLVRHPLMLGFLIAFWATPRMTVGHLLFAALLTLYILLGVWLEERDLLEVHGERYAAYRRAVPMLLPLPRRAARERAARSAP